MEHYDGVLLRVIAIPHPEGAGGAHVSPESTVKIMVPQPVVVEGAVILFGYGKGQV